jgi:hypothetical protein
MSSSLGFEPSKRVLVDFSVLHDDAEFFSGLAIWRFCRAGKLIMLSRPAAPAVLPAGRSAIALQG